MYGNAASDMRRRHGFFSVFIRFKVNYTENAVKENYGISQR